MLEWQRALCRARVAGVLADDVLLLVEHEPVATLGRGFRAGSLPDGGAELRARGIDLVEVERGGDITWHGPGQLVAYPIVHLSRLREDLHWWLRTLEQAVIDAAAATGVAAGVRPGLTGVWTAHGKLASLGVFVRRWVTLHGLALNVRTAPDAFDGMVPCGIGGVTMTSLARELALAGQPADGDALWASAQAALVDALATRLDRRPLRTAPAALADAGQVPQNVR